MEYLKYCETRSTCYATRPTYYCLRNHEMFEIAARACPEAKVWQGYSKQTAFEMNAGKSNPMAIFSSAATSATKGQAFKSCTPEVAEKF